MSAPPRAAVSPEPFAFSPEDFAKAANVSRETLARLKAYVGLLAEWNTRHNLVSASSLTDVWRRHVWDSAQLCPLIPPAAKGLVDLGSGAGFPGLVLAAMLRDREGFRTVLIEATGKKAKFLAEAVARMGLEVEVRNARIEDINPEPFDVVTARACAPLPKLLAYAQHFQGPRTLCLFLKGQNVAGELTEARKCWTMKLEQHESRTDPLGQVLAVRELAHVDRKR